MKYLIKNGRVIDPLNGTDGILDILISGTAIEMTGKDIVDKAAVRIDAKGKIVFPGLVDMHAHLREPGREDKETVATGTRAAVRGGFTRIACMPNTDPAIDDPEKVAKLKSIIKNSALCAAEVIGAITLNREGKKLTDFADMKKAGVAAVSDDGSSVDDEGLMLEALKSAKKTSLLIIEHCEDRALSASGVMNRSSISTKMGLRGIPKEAETARVKRDIELAKKAASAVHIAHVSCAESADLIRKAKRAGVAVTAETAPHYFTLTEECCVTYDTNTKMNPPLRSKEDSEAIKQALSDGTIDAIATDHAPHTDAEKDVEFDFAPFGIIGLETALSLGVMELVEKKVLSWPDLITKMSVNPARILSLRAPGLARGSAADIVVMDPEKEYVYKRSSIESKSKNSPFIDWKLKGRVEHVFVGGRHVMKDEEIL
jgi:dihydroorotase